MRPPKIVRFRPPTPPSPKTPAPIKERKAA